jgi:hypothetical protein
LDETLTHDDKEIVTAILAAGGLSAAKLGLRFDRVAGRIIADLRSFVDLEAPLDATVLVAISAPIRLPARTVSEVKQAIRVLVAAQPQPDWDTEVNGNHVRLRIITGATGQPPKLIGFVHNPNTASEQLLDFAERWLRMSD